MQGFHVWPHWKRRNATCNPEQRRSSDGATSSAATEQWFRPDRRPVWMSAEAFAALPATMRVRELRYKIARPWFRVREVTLVTTLLDARTYTAADLAAHD